MKKILVFLAIFAMILGCQRNVAECYLVIPKGAEILYVANSSISDGYLLMPTAISGKWFRTTNKLQLERVVALKLRYPENDIAIVLAERTPDDSVFILAPGYPAEQIIIKPNRKP